MATLDAEGRKRAADRKNLQERSEEIVFVTPGDPLTVLWKRAALPGAREWADATVAPVYVLAMPDGTFRQVGYLRAGGLTRLTLRADFQAAFKREVLER